MTPLLSVEHLRISYRSGGSAATVIPDLSLAIAPGECYGLVGESGCGKSSLAMAVLGHLGARGSVGGRILFQGRDLVPLSARALRSVRGRQIGAVYQETVGALNPCMKIGDQLVEALRLHHRLPVVEARARAAATLAAVRIADPAGVMRRFPHEISGGQAQRVVIAMALLPGPQFLVMDEPTSSLDVSVEAEIIALIADLRRRLGLTLLFISHNLGLVRRVADRVGVMYAGELVEEGPAAEVIGRPRHPYTRALVACAPRISHRQGPPRPIPGQVVTATQRPPGCAFAPRCAAAVSGLCDVQPIALEAAGAVAVRCLRWRDAATVTEPLAALVPATPGPAVVETRAVTKRFGRAVADDRISLTLRRGETLAVVGESGSGKTTLGRLIAGLERASEGEVVVLDQEVGRLAVEQRPRRLRGALQMVFQNPDHTLNPSQSVAAILSRAVRRLAGLRGRANAAAVSELLSLVGLPAEFGRRRASELSGGQRQRVAIARAFAGRPAIVICDEPTSALDVSVQAAILQMLAEIQRRVGTALLFISHDLALVRQFADRVLVMYGGRVVEQGPTERVFSPPFHPYTQALLAAVSSIDGPAPVAAAAVELPAGTPACAFAARCPVRIDPLCLGLAPELAELGESHVVACHHVAGTTAP